MLGRFITLETFDNAMQAHLVKNHLAAAGIRSVLADEVSASNFWHLSGAIGGIKLQVAEEDLERADAILDELEQAHRSRDGTAMAPATSADEPSEPKPADPEEEEEAPLNLREQLIERAYKSVLVGLVLLPVQFYATWLLLSVWQEDHPIRPALQSKLRWAISLNVPLAIIAFLLMGLWLKGMTYGMAGIY